MKRAAPQQHAETLRSDLLEKVTTFVALAGIPVGEFMHQFVGDLTATPDGSRALMNFVRFIEAGFGSSLLRYFHAHPVLRRVFLELSSQSQYLADILVRTPELLHWLTASDELTRTKSCGDFLADAQRAVAPYERLEKKTDALKRFHRREMLRIGAREILEEADIPTSTAELSALADAVVETALGIAVEELQKRTGLRIPNTLAVVGLGKLGGNELNFSSDIDLMFLYDQDKNLKAPVERIHSHHEFFVRLAELVVRILTERTGEGHLCRVDVRLRPDGHSGPLAMSRQAYVSYYEARGELWERQMLLKARIVAGNREVGRRWLEEIEPFVYPKTMLKSPLEEISAIKARIESRTNTDSNIKLGVGGIRDIEFVVQGLQLVSAGNQPGLRERGTLAAIGKLGAALLLSHREMKSLEEAYLFLRKVEHRQQLLHGQQTHELPETAEEATLLAKRIGFASAEKFGDALNRHRARVRKVYDTVFRLPRGAVKRKTISAAVCAGYTHAETVKSYANEMPEFADESLQTRLVKLLKRLGVPVWGAKNFQNLVSSTRIRSTLRLAIQNKKTLELLALISSRSSRLSQTLSKEPLLFETLINRPEDILSEAFEWKFMLQSDLKRYRVFNETKVVVRHLLDLIPIDHTLRDFSLLAEDIVRECADRLWKGDGGKPAIIALGKLGSRELTLGSDLDLLIVHKGSAHTIEAFARVLVREVQDSAGYQVDLRLRPEGRNAPLAVELKYFEEYLSRRAAVWEKQSLLRARKIWGDDVLAKEFRTIARKAVSSIAETHGWIHEIMQMRQRMEDERTDNSKGIDLKLATGGLADLEFAIQMIFLGSKEMMELQNEPVKGLLKPMKEFSLQDRKKFEQNYLFLRQMELLWRLNSERNDFVVQLHGEQIEAVARGIGMKSVSRLVRRLELVRRENRQYLNRVAQRCEH